MTGLVGNYISRLNRNRALLLTLSIEDFRNQYRGAFLGVFWAIIRPALFVLAIWLVVAQGLKGARLSDDDVPFIVHLLCGYLPWLLFAESVTGAMNSLHGNRFLLREASFQPSLFPVIKYGSTLILHALFLVIVIVVLIAHGYYPSVYWLQLPLLIAALQILVVGIGWLTSSMRLFSSDVTQVVGVVLQVGFWVTPVFWSISRLPEEVRHLTSFNPMVFIVEGYRMALLREQWFWSEPVPLFWFLAISTAVCIVGAFVFRRLRPHFGEMI